MSDSNFFSEHMDLITCKKCGQLFKNPVTQACGHTFCQDCLSIFTNNNGQTANICFECGVCNIFENQNPNLNISVKSMIEHYLRNCSHLNGNEKVSALICSTCKIKIVINETFTCKTCNGIDSLAYNFYCGNCGWSFHKGHNFIQVEFISKEERDKLIKMLCDTFSNFQQNYDSLLSSKNDLILKRENLKQLSYESDNNFAILLDKIINNPVNMRHILKLEHLKKKNIESISSCVSEFNQTMSLYFFSLNNLKTLIEPIQKSYFIFNNIKKIIDIYSPSEYEPPYKKKNM
uniref:RING-type domain-containing protein n=1 Tax=Parastrongyloides trichosuri TaxID=131310 RepID=A0A0N4ZRD4_PARTI